MHALLFFLLLTSSPAALDTLVVCPAEFRPALADWMEYRRKQGHDILIIEPQPSPDDLKAAIRQVARGGRLKYVLLVGDVPGGNPESIGGRNLCIPTNYVQAHINTRWGSEPTIATDNPYSDLDSDGAPDLAIGRIAADSVDELHAALEKILRYEQAEGGPWQRRLNVVVGAGGFGKVTDTLIESAGRSVFQQCVPAGYELLHTAAPTRAQSLPPDQVRSQLHAQLSKGCLTWIYLGHGLPNELDRLPAAIGGTPLLSTSDVANLRCGCRTPLAVLVACYTGAIDARRDCLAEELSLTPEGPVAVIAATRVTMPYGNTVLGYELLRACFEESAPTIRQIMLRAQQRTLHVPADDPMRTSLDAMCRGLSPPPVDLAAERAEHVQMYHLLGDPLLRLRRDPARVATSTTNDVAK